MRALAPALAALLLAGCVEMAEDAGPLLPRTGDEEPSVPAEPSRVEVRGLDLYVNGSATTVRGVTYAPVPVGWRNGLGWIHEPTVYGEDLTLLREMGANAIRLVAAPERSEDAERFMDALAMNGLHVVMGVPGPMRQDASDPAVREATLRDVERVVEDWKDHPAVLLWTIGNEVNYLYGGDDVTDWYTLLEEAAALAKRLDPNHPVATAESGVKDTELLVRLAPSVDVLGVNHYNFDVGDWSGYFLPETARLAPRLPVLVTEFGMDAFDSERGVPDEAEQARQLLGMLDAIEGANNTIGAFVYEWVDEWWKVGSPWVHDETADWKPYRANETLVDGALSEEWFGLVAQSANTTERTPREAYRALTARWVGR